MTKYVSYKQTEGLMNALEGNCDSWKMEGTS